MGKLRFYKIVKRLGRMNRKLSGLLDDAIWLRKARNEIVAHPIYIGNPFVMKKPGYLEFEEPELQIWASKIMLRDISKLLWFVEPDKRKEIEEKKFTKKGIKAEYWKSSLLWTTSNNENQCVMNQQISYAGELYKTN